MRKLYALALTLGLLLVAVPAFASAPPVINVDGVEYPAGPPFASNVDHYYTPGASSVGSAFTTRHVWNGINGAELIPCEGGYHWVDNNNLLTISHCLPVITTTTTTTTTTIPVTTTTVPVTTTTVPVTTTTVPDTTTTTVPDTTTTTVPDTTTTTIPVTTTTVPDTTTTTDPTTTTVPVTSTTVPTTLPRTGAGDLAPWAIGGLILVALGGMTVWLTREN